MDRARTLAVVSAAQLGAGVAGMVVAQWRVHPYDVFWLHGQPEVIARDTLFKGTALSAPVSTLVTQAALIAVMARRPSRRAARAPRRWPHHGGRLPGRAAGAATASPSWLGRAGVAPDHRRARAIGGMAALGEWSPASGKAAWRR